MTPHFPTTLAATLALLVPLAGAAQTAPTTPPPTAVPAQAGQPAPVAPLPPMAPAKPQRLRADKFAQVDANHDGAISRDEAAAAPRLSAAFDQIDADRDGRILPAELKAYAKTHRGEGKADGKAGKPGKNFDKLDLNHDGVITRDEVAGNPKAMKRFEAADADRDGRVTPDEARALRAK